MAVAPFAMEETEHRFDSLILNLALCLDIMLKTDNEIKRIAHIDPFVPLGYPDLVYYGSYGSQRAWLSLLMPQLFLLLPLCT